MLKTSSILAVAAVLTLGACENIDTDGERALVGAGLAAGAAAATGADDRDTALAAAGGAVAGALCDDTGICR